MKDPYTTLGISPTATPEEIKKAYRALAKKYHPDVSSGNKAHEQLFKDITAAYDLVSDPEKRARYDRGELDAQGNEAPGFRRRSGPGGRAGAQNFQDITAEDIFADLFGQAAQRGRGRYGGRGFNFDEHAETPPEARGSDVSYAITIPFLEACLGSTRRVTLTSGKTIDITIPPGTEDQQKLRLKGQGLSGLGGGPRGDALVNIQVEPHPCFTRHGAHIYLETPIALHEAVLGGTIPVATLDGSVTVKVPKGANTGTQLRLKGKGTIDQKTGTRGDQYVKLKIVLPEKLDDKFTQFIEKWAKDHAYDPRNKSER